MNPENNGSEWWFLHNLDLARSHLFDAVQIYESMESDTIPVQIYNYVNGSLCFVEFALRDFDELFPRIQQNDESEKGDFGNDTP